MAEAHCILQVVLERKGALPADAVVNTWHFQSEGAGALDSAESLFDENISGLLDRTDTFYSALGGMWGAHLSGNGTAKAYLYEDDVPRVPRATRDFTFGTLPDAMPGEVALCLSMAASIASGQIAARRRGRVFIGPLGRNLSTYTTGAPDGRPGLTEINLLLDSAESYATGASSEGFKLAVFSPTTVERGGSTDEAWNLVHTLWVDNAWDIQRRRGAAPTSREERSV